MGMHRLTARPEHFKRVRDLRDAYRKEFRGNLKGQPILKDAEAWAKDYPDIFEEYRFHRGNRI